MLAAAISLAGCSKSADNSGAEQKVHEDYESAYVEYVKENTSYFERGMVLCDLNADNIPELFSVEDSEDVLAVTYHMYDTEAGALSANDSIATYVDINRFIEPTGFYMNPTYFFGLYENKKTGNLALINSKGAPDGQDIFDVIQYDGKELTVLKHGVEDMIGHSWPIDEARDEIMADYRLSDKKIFSKILLRGSYDGENPTVDIEPELKDLIAQFKEADYTIDYHKAPEGEFWCYIRDVDLEKKEIELIPAATITADEYKKAMESDKLVKINGEEMSIQIDEFALKEYGIVGLHRMPDITHTFYEPSEHNPESVVRGYMGNAPVKVSIGDDLMVKCGLCRTPALEQLCGKSSHTSEEFFGNYAALSNKNYYKALVKDGVLKELNQIYRE